MALVTVLIVYFELLIGLIDSIICQMRVTIPKILLICRLKR